MADTRLSNCFSPNEFFWKLFGLWPGRCSSKYYKYYSIPFLFVTLLMYNIALTLNLIFTPKTIDLLIPEVIFYFTEVAVAFKAFMILFKRKQILKSFELLDDNFFKGDDEVTEKIVKDDVRKYLFSLKFYTIFSHLICYNCLVFVPVFLYFLLGSTLELPVCKYYFLSDEIREKYFTFWFIYQSIGIYTHMVYNIYIDSFMSGYIFACVTQLKVINHKLKNLRVDSSKRNEKVEVQEQNMSFKFQLYLEHYSALLNYHNMVQNLINIPMFVQFGMSAAIICVTLCGLTLHYPFEANMFLLSYLFLMTGQIFVPGWLGTEIIYENQRLAFAAYNSDWIPRSERFKRCLRLFVERANAPLELKGLKMFALNLGTFSYIIKMAYSLFTLVRKVQNRETGH